MTNLESLYNESPCYVFDGDKAIKRIQNLSEKLPRNAKLCYAIKANAFLLRSLKDENILFEVCSSGELSICENLKLDSKKIVFSGVCKTQEDVNRAYNLNVHTITLESVAHCKYLLEVTKNQKEHNQNVILRLTSGNQFGMSESDILSCIEEIKKVPSINIRGIHFFTGTQKNIKKIREEIDFIIHFCDNLKAKTGIDFSDIEYGPGYSYDYFSLHTEEEQLSDFNEVNNLIKDTNYNWVLESGRFIASPCGKYITKIMDVKDDEKNRYCIIDGGINHVNYYGQMMGMKIPPIEHIHAEKVDTTSTEMLEEKYTICGSLCTTADVLLRALPLKSPKINDVLVFGDIGAYSITEGIYLFLSHPLPKVFIKQNNKIEQVRAQIETYKLNY